MVSVFALDDGAVTRPTRPLAGSRVTMGYYPVLDRA